MVVPWRYEVEHSGLIVLAALMGAYAFVSKRLSNSGLTGPLLFMVFGLIAGPPGLDWITPERGTELISLVLEATLVVILFTDAFEIELGDAHEAARLPGRLLGVGFPLMVLVGWGVAAWMFPQLGGAAALLVAIVLAPTDAALGQAVVSNPRVPERIRNALNIESGLNDGLALPLFFVVLEVASTSAEGGGVLRAILVQVLVASLVGVALGTAAAWAGVQAARRDWTDAGWVQIALVSVALAAWGLADGLGGSGFIAAWAAGLSCGIVARSRLERPVEFSADLGNVMMLICFALFGSVVLGPVLSRFDLPIIVYALLSLAAIRMVSVIVATAGARLAWPTKIYLGWYGPRGLASIILAVVVVAEGEVPETQLVTDLMAATVGLSVILHGLTSWRGSNLYGEWCSRSLEASGSSP